MSSAAAAAAGGGAEEGQREGPLPFVLGLPVALPLRDAVSRMDAGVRRKARTGRQLPRPRPAGWLAFRLPVPPPVKAKKPPAKKKKKPPAGQAGSPRPQRQPVLGLLAPSPPDLGAAAAAAAPPDMEKPAKKARMCVQCGSVETPQWRSGPNGRSTLCNACGVRLRAAGALREAVLSPPAAKKAVVTPPPPPPAPAPESPASDSSPDSPIWQRQAPLQDVYLPRKPPTRERRPARKESPPPSPVVYLVKKKKPSLKKWRPRNTGQRCQHCGTTSTPQWREGPMGRHTLCNACGVRYRQGRLLPEYRPAASPTFKASEHASRHRDVLQLHRLQQQQQQPQQQPPEQLQPVAVVVDDDDGKSGDDKNNVFLVRRERPVKEYPPTPLHRPLLQLVDNNDDPRVGGNKDSAGRGGGGDAPDALDSLLLGPSAPLIVDGADFLVR